MPYYRILSQNEIHLACKEGFLATNKEQWNDYKIGTVVLLLNTDNPQDVFIKYRTAIANHRGLTTGDKLFLLLITKISSEIEEDQSKSSGCEESIAHFGRIPIDYVSVVAETDVTKNGGTLKEFSGIRFYKSPMNLCDI